MMPCRPRPEILLLVVVNGGVVRLVEEQSGDIAHRRCRVGVAPALVVVAEERQVADALPGGEVALPTRLAVASVPRQEAPEGHSADLVGDRVVVPVIVARVPVKPGPAGTLRVLRRPPRESVDDAPGDGTVQSRHAEQGRTAYEGLPAVPEDGSAGRRPGRLPRARAVVGPVAPVELRAGPSPRGEARDPPHEAVETGLVLQRAELGETRLLLGPSLLGPQGCDLGHGPLVQCPGRRRRVGRLEAREDLVVLQHRLVIPLVMLLAQPPRQYARVSRPPSRSSHGGPPLPPLLSRGRRRRIRRRTTGTAPPADYLADRGARGASGTLTHERQGGGPFDLRVERRAPSAHRLDEASRTGTVASGRHCFAGFFLTAWPVSCPAVVEIARLCSVDSLSASGLFPQLFK
mmetsp:Transcript_5698/g.12935  ORF Transcript_5698/g.12935 Transcript_5698/m.12935 type:complete len:404 (-) Transcript_5698:151-1362(-)